MHPNIVTSRKHQTILAKHLACCVHFLKQPCKVIFVDMSMGWQSMYTTTSMFLLPYVLGHLLMVVEWMLRKISAGGNEYGGGEYASTREQDKQGLPQTRLVHSSKQQPLIVEP